MSEAEHWERDSKDWPEEVDKLLSTKDTAELQKLKGVLTATEKILQEILENRLQQTER